MEIEYNAIQLYQLAQVDSQSSVTQEGDTMDNSDAVVRDSVAGVTESTFVQENTNSMIYGLGLVVLLFLIFFFYVKKIADNLNCKLKKVKKELEDYNEQLQNVRYKCENILQKIESLNATEKKGAHINPAEDKKEISEVDHIGVSKQVVTIVKYADFYKEDDVPTIENRDLSDDNLSGMFMITMKEGASNATYTINRARMSSIMEDVAVISDYVEGLQHVSNVTAIEIVEEGTLSKHGNVWKVNKKMKVKIV